MNSLEQLIRKRIATDGPMSFRDFMAAALYEPGMGYYMRDDTEIGAGGDFYTSPHAHPVFGAMLARQAEECWELMGKPREFKVLEAGSGRGFLALDMLDYLKGRDLYERISYLIVELNPGLEARQRDLLKGHLNIVSWHRDMESAGQVRGIILTNELLDALSVHLVVMQEELREIYVALAGESLIETPGPLSDPAVGEYLKVFGAELVEGMRSEVHLAMKDWLSEAAEALVEGFLLTIDYGLPADQYYSVDRPQGTLLCYHRHRAHEDFLINPGSQDITAHVNFSALKRWGESLGLSTLGFTRQGPYLVSLGIDEVITEWYAESGGPGRDLSKIQNLIMAGTMGDTHKVMLQCTEGLEGAAPRGFKLKNQLASL
jgi:SAM-dependent MidA family methyltransferase